MIAVLLWLLAIALIFTTIFVVGRLIHDIWQFFSRRIRQKGASDLPPMWRDVTGLAIAAQIGAIVVLALVGGYFWTNFTTRADDIGLDLSFDFLAEPAQITIADNPLSPADSVGEALAAGFLNTIRIIVVGIPVSLLLGTLVAIARLSSNWLLRKIATGYVEFFRNIPPLVVIIFIWRVVFLEGFPAAVESWQPGGWFIFNNSRFAIPSIAGQENFATFRLLLIAGLVVAIAVGVWRTRVFNQTGQPHHRVVWSVGTFLAIGIVSFVVLGGPAAISRPEVDEAGRVYTGGFRMEMPYAALTTALVVYTGTHIAEIVRGSILAVHKGQVEAANALALSAFQRYRFVILPQAMRIAFPPLINQFLNFSKNTSLALAIGFAETTSLINNLFGQSQPAPQLILILMLLYLTLSLVLSAIGNLVNRRLRIVGR